MSFWDAVETLSDRGKSIVSPRQSVKRISFPVAVVSLIALAVAAVPLMLLDPDSADGLPMLSLFLFPMVAGAVVIELVVLCKLGQQDPDWTLLWWPLVILPAGLLAMSVRPMLADPDYFDVVSFSSAVGVLFSFAFLVFFGLGLSFVFWGLVVFPLRVLGLAVFDALRGDRVAGFRVYAPLVFLGIPAISVTVVLSLGELEGSRAAIGQIVQALLGVPGDYEVVWEPGLWIVRAITLALIGGAIWTIVRSKRNARKNKA
ncbi:hypothetical protein [Microbacterium sp.]|uniref:hypothetical protein n=1 Tax=Microbacterium sp. TaxID=51671 RepID=UPI00260E8CFA|nr:hypothetical protein [Microbacterium sp.]